MPLGELPPPNLRKVPLLPSISILYSTQDTPFGGANQFLKALDAEFLRQGCRAATVEAADVILFNSHHEPERVLKARRRFPRAIFLHRVDGPMRLYNRPDDRRDAVVARLNDFAADATVFQSGWSRDQNRKLGWVQSGPEAVIGNAPDPSVFHPPAQRRVPGKPVRLIATSWSSHPRKGFDVYDYLDRHLDFERFGMTFIGNSPVTFSRIRQLPPLPSLELAEQLREADIFITGSQSDPCSNSLTEALHCRLPAIARNDGGHPEILGKGGLLFEDPKEIPALLERLLEDYDAYVSGIRVPSIEEIAKRYIDFAQSLIEMRGQGNLRPKRPGLLSAWRLGRRLAADG
ncbi:MAG: glycosyltransferase family 1 protein [Rhodospirillales bacterium]|nr:MAG: glycosyltransferase family 1 protein [Rhodospirillales bacterium]